MILYNLSNPSDAYTFQAPDRQTAFLVVGFFGSSYGASVLEGAEKSAGIPITLFGGFDEVGEQILGVRPDGFEGEIRKRADALAQAFESFCCGDRDGFDALTREQKIDRNNERRSSMNDIGKRAFAYADACRLLVSEAR